ncbi:hypothetical protein G6F55_012239 [Rhizopus delemar]|nr:hypothetical protein G6F55_012239 [Rhizopus delemar]
MKITSNALNLSRTLKTPSGTKPSPSTSMKVLPNTSFTSSGHLDLTDVFKGQAVDTWAKLPAKLGLSSHGEVHLVAEFVAQ